MNRYSPFLILFLVSAAMGCSKKVYRQESVVQLPVEEYLSKMAEEEHYYLLDIRTGLEYKSNHIEGARHINFLSFSFGKKIAELDTTKTVFIYCQTAHRSPLVAKKLWKKGFRKIVDLEGGFRKYKKYKKKEAVSKDLRPFSPANNIF
jgi:rhodanese-related sulfurtransferase